MPVSKQTLDPLHTIRTVFIYICEGSYLRLSVLHVLLIPFKVANFDLATWDLADCCNHSIDPRNLLNT